jgi:hypothetical protein
MNSYDTGRHCPQSPDPLIRLIKYSGSYKRVARARHEGSVCTRVISEESIYDEFRLICTHKFADLNSLHIHFIRGQLIARRGQYPFHDPRGKTHISDTQCLGNFPSVLGIKSVKLPVRVLCGQLVVQLCHRLARCTPFGPEFNDDGSCTADLEMGTSMVSPRPWRRATYDRVELSHRINVDDGHCELWRYVYERARERSSFFADLQYPILRPFIPSSLGQHLSIVSHQYSHAPHDVQSLHLRIGSDLRFEQAISSFSG